MKKKLFIVPNNDAEAIRIQKLINDNNLEGDYEIVLTGQGWGASWEGIEEDILEKIQEAKRNDTEIYAVEIKGVPKESKVIGIDHHKYYDTDMQSVIGEKTSIEQVAEILGVKLSNFDKMVAANDVGYISKMIKMAEELGLTDEERANIIDEIDKLESIAKTLAQLGKSRISVEEVHGIEEIVMEAKKKNVSIAQDAIDKAYVYDERLIWINLDDFNCQREVTNLLYKMEKYRDMAYNNIVVSSIDNQGIRRLVYFGKRENIEMLNDAFQDQKIRWTGGEKETGFLGIQLDENEKYEAISERMRYLLEENLLGYHRIVKQEDIISSKENGKNIRIHEISNPLTFYSAISASQTQNDHSSFVHVYDVEEYENKKLFLVNAGCAGCAVTEEGDIISVFKNDDMVRKDDTEKIFATLLLTAIENGGNKLDCFEDFLHQNYMKYGFIPVCKVPFNDEFVQDGLNNERDERPYIIFLKHNGESIDVIMRKQKEGTYKKYDVDSIPVIEDYDEAAAFRDGSMLETGKDVEKKDEL